MARPKVESSKKREVFTCRLENEFIEMLNLKATKNGYKSTGKFIEKLLKEVLQYEEVA